ncbi:MAG: hypothetical protein GX657_10585 [Chloroflexi bacterium]|nr:hypothetical protein [Chloroflexota bacterium]
MATMQATNNASVYRGPSLAARISYVAAIIVNVILWVIAHQLLEWGIPFVTADWPDVLWAVRLSLGASIVANALYLFYDARWFRRLGDIVTGSAALMSLVVMFVIFPFALPINLMQQCFRLGLLALAICQGIAILVHTVRLLSLGDEA